MTATRHGLWLAGCLAVVAVSVVLHVAAHQPLSAIDEIQHMDYVVSVQHRDVVHRGDQLGVPAMRVQACRGVDPPSDRDLPACDAPATAFDPGAFVGGGFNHQYQHVPVYHGVTAVGASLLESAGVEDPLDQARLVGVAWALAAAGVLWAGLGLFGVGPAARFGAAVLLCTAPAILLSLSIVNNDATAPLAGAVLVLLAGLARHGRPEPRWLALLSAAVAVFAVAAKATNGLAVLGACVAFAVAMVRAPAGSDARRRAGFAAGGLFGGGSLAAAGYLLYQRLIAAPDPVPIPLFQTYEADALPVRALTRGLTQVVSPLVVGEAGPLGSDVGLVGGNLVAAVVLLGMGAAAVVAHRSHLVVGLAGGAVLALMLRVPLVGLANYIANDVDKVSSTPLRYGQSLAPVALAVIAVAVWERTPRRGTRVLVGVALLQAALVAGLLVAEL